MVTLEKTRCDVREGVRPITMRRILQPLELITLQSSTETCKQWQDIKINVDHDYSFKMFEQIK